jgi:phospholipase C
MGGMAGAGIMIGTGASNMPHTLARKTRLAATPTIIPTATGTGDGTSIQHVLIFCQENRTFDTYFGMYPKAGSYGIPSNYTQPDGKGGTVAPQHATQPTSTDISHIWSDIHSEWDNGAMDGFVTTDGAGSMIYYDGSDVSRDYTRSSVNSFALCLCPARPIMGVALFDLL